MDLIDKKRQEINVDIAKLELNKIGEKLKVKQKCIENHLPVLHQRSDETKIKQVLQSISYFCNVLYVMF